MGFQEKKLVLWGIGDIYSNIAWNEIFDFNYLPLKMGNFHSQTQISSNQKVVLTKVVRHASLVIKIPLPVRLIPQRGPRSLLKYCFFMQTKQDKLVA